MLIDAPLHEVWALVTDINLAGRFQEEFVEAEWIDPGPALEAKFLGRNARGDRTWETTSWVTTYEPMHAFGWSVSDRDNPMVRVYDDDEQIIFEQGFPPAVDNRTLLVDVAKASVLGAALRGLGAGSRNDPWGLHGYGGGRSTTSPSTIEVTSPLYDAVTGDALLPRRAAGYARVATAVIDITTMSLDLQAFKEVNGRYPETLTEAGLDGATDPWGQAYRFLGDLEVDFSDSQSPQCTPPECTPPVPPETASWQFEKERWAFRGSVGVRVHWMPQ